VVFYRRTSTLPMLNEIKSIESNAKKLAAIDDSDVPLLFFVSNGEVTGFDKNEWRTYVIDYIDKKANGGYLLLDCAHSVHNIKPALIHAESIKFIESLR
jgi:hypothetical protein